MRLKKGSEQVKRKAQFVIDNAPEFEDKIGSIANKEVVRLVITNYPTFTGFVIDEVPIIDFNLLESYISSGKITNLRLELQDGKIVSDKEVSHIVFYNTEDEFCANLKSSMEKPVAIEQVKPLLHIVNNKFSLKQSEYDMYVTSAEFKE